VADVVPSEELRSFLLRLYSAWEAQDFEALREMFSTGAHVLVIGTDPDEWWTGSDVLEVWILQTREVGGFSAKPRRLTAYCIGNVGWVADEPLVTFGNGVEIRMRVTAVLVIERGHWRIAHWHASIAQTNEESIGLSLTTSIDKIERSVRDERPDVRPASAPDGTVTIVFSDLESSTVLLDRLGDTEFLRMLAWHDRVVRDTAQEHRGFVVKSQGDGFMLAFPSAAFALRASLVMRDRIAAGFDGLPIRIRAGLHSGEAIKHDDDFYGRTVVIAARISALALGGEILASDLVYALARGLGTFTFGDPRTATLKGLGGSFDLHPVLG
jgi:class 3 adenylate cyclase